MGNIVIQRTDIINLSIDQFVDKRIVNNMFGTFNGTYEQNIFLLKLETNKILHYWTFDKLIDAEVAKKKIENCVSVSYSDGASTCHSFDFARVVNA